MNARRVQKQATRERVLEAARELFEEIGYDTATIRAIAARAGVSVGTVFNSFTTKADILSQVMQDRLDGLYAELDHVTPLLRGPTPDRLRSIFAIYYSAERHHPRLFLAHIAGAYAWTPDSAATPFGRTPRLKQVIRDCLQKGVEEGDVEPALDLDLAVDLLLGAYAWTYRLSAWEGADAAALSAVMDQQIGLVTRGLLKRA